MLGSISRMILIVIVSAALGLGVIALSELTGSITIHIYESELRISILTGVISLVAFVVILWLSATLLAFLFSVARFISGDETALTRYFDRARRSKGYRALFSAVAALSEGDKEKAISQSKKANKLLNNDQLATLISAQVSQQTGNSKLAISEYKKLLIYSESRSVALNGIISEKIKNGEYEDALRIVKKSIQLNPKNLVALTTLFNLQIQEGDWSGARHTLRQKYKIEKTGKSEHLRQEAVLLFAEAKESRAKGHISIALKTALAAVKQYPSFVAALSMVAELEILSGNKKRLAGLLKKGWSANPHPQIAAAFASIVPDESPEQRIKRFAPFIKNQSLNPQAKILNAELLIAREDFPAARRAISDLAEKDPDNRVLFLMAAIERGSGASDNVVKGWLAKAASAQRCEEWICKNCGTQNDWVVTCPKCEGFDTMEWKRPSFVKDNFDGSQILPLILDKNIDSQYNSSQHSEDVEDDQSKGATLNEKKLDKEILEKQQDNISQNLDNDSVKKAREIL